MTKLRDLTEEDYRQGAAFGPDRRKDARIVVGGNVKNPSTAFMTPTPPPLGLGALLTRVNDLDKRLKNMERHWLQVIKVLTAAIETEIEKCLPEDPTPVEGNEVEEFPW